MLVPNPTHRPKPTSSVDRLEYLIGRYLVDIARGEQLIRRQSMLLSIADNRESLSVRRHQLEKDVASCIVKAHNLGIDHGLDPLRDIHGVDLQVVQLAIAPLKRKGGAA